MSSEPLSITVAPNGARRGKGEHAAVPLTPDEIAADARACRAAGAAILHLHVRGPDGRHSLDVGRFREAIAAVREACDIVIQPTTERGGRYAPDDMIEVFRGLRPEMITVNLSELLEPGDVGHQGRAPAFLAEIAAAGTVPQYIVYRPEELDTLRRWWEQGWVPQAQPWVLLVLGSRGGPGGHPRELLDYLPHLPEAWHWGVCAFGMRELACVVQGALAGGHCRVGFENNLYSADGARLADNAEQVGRLRHVLGELGIATMTPAQVRRAFGLPAR